MIGTIWQKWGEHIISLLSSTLEEKLKVTKSHFSSSFSILHSPFFFFFSLCLSLSLYVKAVIPEGFPGNNSERIKEKQREEEGKQKNRGEANLQDKKEEKTEEA